MSVCVICKNKERSSGKNTCGSDECIKIFVTSLVKPDLDNSHSISSGRKP